MPRRRLEDGLAALARQRADAQRLAAMAVREPERYLRLVKERRVLPTYAAEARRVLLRRRQQR